MEKLLYTIVKYSHPEIWRVKYIIGKPLTLSFSTGQVQYIYKIKFVGITFFKTPVCLSTPTNIPTAPSPKPSCLVVNDPQI
jgi:hypothetical protein